MTVFATVAETRQLGEPVVGLFRTALGRDPDIHELAAFVAMLRSRATLPILAERLVATAEFQNRHGAALGSDVVSALCRNAFGSDAAGPRAAALAAALAAELGATAAELVASIAGAALARRVIPLLPGLAPGAAPDDPIAYRLWVDAYDRPDPAALARLPHLIGPRISVAMAAGDTEAEAALRTVASLQDQIYPHWELCLAARTLSPWSREAIRGVAADPRVRLIEPGSLREALANATGPLACLLAPGDRLPPAAFHEVAQTFMDHPGTALLYTDEDVEEAGMRHSPRLKPGHSPDVSPALIGQLAVYRAALVAELGGLPDGPQPMLEFARRATAAAHGRVRHLPAVLCHRGTPPAPIAMAPQPLRSAVPDPPPLVTVIVLTRDRASLLAACVQGLLERTSYPSIELLVVDNGSIETDALALLAELERRPLVRVLRQPGPFNFAAFNNVAAAEARGEVLLLLNNDTEVLGPDWLGAMVQQVLRPHVGAVGARLLYPNGTVQHAGILLGPNGAATHVGRGAAADDPGYLGQLACVRELSAVTGACLAIRAAVWRAVGGMDERLAVTWNDIDLCLRVRQAGLRVIWTPQATLLHREAASRGSEADDAERLARFRSEQALVQTLWGDAVEHDPFLNPNLVATEAGPLALGRPRRPHPGPSTDLR